ncbi:MAG: hypothetical protein ACREHV_00475 [Rhizomicrobium sp.]
MFQAEPKPSNTTVIVQHRGQGGVLAGILGCIFGVLGIFSFGLIFVPLAALCSLIGFVRGIGGRSPAGIGTSILAAMLCFWGFAVSPSLWALLAAGIIAQHVSAPAPSAPAPNPAAVALQRMAQQQRQFVSQLDALNHRMKHDDGVFDNWITMLPITEHQYSEITTQMEKYLERERELAGDPRTFAARSQISVAMEQGPLKTDQIHNQVQPAQWNFANNGGPLMQQIKSYQNACDEIRSKASDEPVGQAAQAVEATCTTFQSALPPFKARYEAVSQGLARAEATYQRERQVQEQLINAAYQLQ